VTAGFRHEALLYEGNEAFVRGTGSFVREGLDADETVLVVVDRAKIEMLRDHLGDDARHVSFEDMSAVGRNPARIIPLWRRFVAAQAGSRKGLRGVGEPIDARRSPDALVECERHESLLNVAFHDGPSWSLLCPYDTRSLPASVIEEALRNHPCTRNGRPEVNPAFRGLESCAAPFDIPLAEPPPSATRFVVDRDRLAELRAEVARHAEAHGLGGREADDLALVVHELATNSIRHGGGAGELLLWSDGPRVVAEMRDRGRIVDPLAGRVQPGLETTGGYGLWLANHLCDLVQIRAYRDGGAVRVHLARD